MAFKVTLNMSKSSFPETGIPLYPNSTKDVKPSKDIRDDYNDYTQECNSAHYAELSDFEYYYSNILNTDGNNMTLNLDYETETSKTYKFLGMDIDEDYNAIIKMGTGHVVVGSMFDRDLILNNIQNNTRYSTDDFKNACISAVSTLNQEDVRKLSTAVKTGIAYTMANSAKMQSTLVGPDTWKKLMEITTEASTSVGGGLSTKFKSILLNLVHQKELENTQVKANSSDDSITSQLLGAVLKSWCDIVKKYDGMYTTLACMDIWSGVEKRMIGNDVFNSKMKSCVSISDADTGESYDGMISFSGVSKNANATDENVVRKYSSEAFSTIAASVVGNREAREVDSKDLLLGFADVSGIDDIYSVDENELQALSVLDSLQYIDEDASLCKESYDMNNPDERGLFVKSSIRSYERNFKEFKPANNYDVTEALADMVDRGDLATAKIVSAEDMNTNDETDDTIVSSTVSEIDASKIRSDLLKVMKLVNKAAGKVLAGF